MALKQTPLIRENPLTGGWSVITRYKRRMVGETEVIEALEKFDVTDQVEEIHALLARRESNPIRVADGDEVE